MTNVNFLHVTAEQLPLAAKAIPGTAAHSGEDVRPHSAVSAGTGLAGSIALAILLLAAYRFSLGGLQATFLLLAGTASFVLRASPPRR